MMRGSRHWRAVRETPKSLIMEHNIPLHNGSGAAGHAPGHARSTFDAFQQEGYLYTSGELSMPIFPHTPHPGEDAGAAPQTLWTREFLLLFMLAMFANSYIAVFYSFEHWLVTLGIAPHWRGGLLSAMFVMVMLGRPVASVWVIRHNALPVMAMAIIVNSAAMFTYAHLDSPYAILLLRMTQGLALAAFSSSVVSVLVRCIPKGQSARGFALFSLTLLLPYSVVPLSSERLLPLLGGESRLYAAAGLMGVPALCMLIPLARKISAALSLRALLHALRHSGLGWVFLACTFFGSMTILVICFVKGLAQADGSSPSLFFTAYSSLVILTRLLSGNHLDTLPRMPVIYICCFCLALSLIGLAVGPAWMFLPLACLYGLGLGMLYPLLAAIIYDGSTPETRSINSNMMMLTFDFSATMGPLLGGTVISAGYGYPGVFLLAATVISLCAACAFRHSRTSRARAAR